MKTLRTPAILAVAVLASAGLTLSACATAGGAGQAESVTVQIENRLTPSASVTVWIVPELGGRELLGTVNSNSTNSFDFEATTAGRYQLVAQRTAGAELASRPFSIPDGTTTVRWDMSTNTIHHR